LEHAPSSLLALPATKKPPAFVAKFGIVPPTHLIMTPATLSLQNYLRSIGYATRAIPYPIVPKGQERIRVCVHAGNTEKDLNNFIASLLDWAKTAQSAQLAVTPSIETEVRSRL
jgi:8-amino-7-oxononanoate synthase